MKLRVEVICERDSGAEPPKELMALSRHELVMETLRLTLAEGKELLQALQRYLVDQQATEYLEESHNCPRCGGRFIRNGQGSQINTDTFADRIQQIDKKFWHWIDLNTHKHPLTFTDS